MHTLCAAYRLQFEPGFRFEDALGLVPALQGLGISHVYASPVCEPVPGSRHGCDVIDPGQVRAALGGAQGWRALASALQTVGMGLLADVVPNRVAVSGNSCSSDVLEHGRQGPCVEYFDVNEDETAPSAAIVISILAAPYGTELEARHLVVLEEGRARHESPDLAAWHVAIGTSHEAPPAAGPEAGTSFHAPPRAVTLLVRQRGEALS